MKKFTLLLILVLSLSEASLSQSIADTLAISSLNEKIRILERNELVQSMAQRSLLIPSYHPVIKSLIAAQAYNFWTIYNNESLVSHLNVYLALHYGNKAMDEYLATDSTFIIDRNDFYQVVAHRESVISTVFGDDPRYFYSSSTTGEIMKWDLDNIGNVPEQIYEGKHIVKSIDVSDNDQYVMVVTKDQGIIFLGQGGGLLETTPSFADPEVVQIATFVPGKPEYVTINKSGELKVKTFSNKEKHLSIVDEKVTSLTVTDHGESIFVGTEVGNVKTWNSERTSGSYDFDRSYSINSLAINPAGNLLAIGREKGDVILWDLELDSVQRIISGHQSAITDLDFHPTEPLLLSASRDGTARIWDLNNPKKFPLVLDDHYDWVLTATFDKNGGRIITGSKDNFIRIWPTTPKVLADRLCNMLSRNMSEEEWQEYVGDLIDYQQTCPNLLEEN